MEEVTQRLDGPLFNNLTHWSHPNFFAFFPSITSTPAILGSFYNSFIQTYNEDGAQAANYHELEGLVIESMREVFGIPDTFSSKNNGAGYIVPTCGNSSIITTHIAKMRKLRGQNGELDKSKMSKLVGYFPDVSHSHAVKALSINNYQEVREIPSRYDAEEGNFKMDESALLSIIQDDISKGLIPTFLMSVIGATPTGGNDDLVAIGEICKEHEIYMMVDAAYAGVFFVCEELRHMIHGLEHADSYLLNFSKNMLIGMDSPVLYVNDAQENLSALNNGHVEAGCVSDFRVGEDQKNALFKLMFMQESFGIEGMRKHIYDGVEVCKRLEELINQDER